MNLIQTIKNFFDDFDLEIQSDELAPKITMNEFFLCIMSLNPNDALV